MATTWDPSTLNNVALSNGNLTATCTGLDGDGNAGAIATTTAPSSKIYLEITVGTTPTDGGVILGFLDTTDLDAATKVLVVTGTEVNVGVTDFVSGTYANLSASPRLARPAISASSPMSW